MEALNSQIQILEEQLAKFWRRNSQSNPGAHMEVRELKQELHDLQEKRKQLQLLSTLQTFKSKQG
jgi:polyhydroxyalkanoate synthesis regulator phasin